MIKRRGKQLSAVGFCLCVLLSGCGKKHMEVRPTHVSYETQQETNGHTDTYMQEQEVLLSSKKIQLEDGLYAVEFQGDDLFETFLQQGGAAGDLGVMQFLAKQAQIEIPFSTDRLFGCSTISVVDEKGNHLFGRNFDWDRCEALVVVSKPQTGYASISTVNMDFITQNANGEAKQWLQQDELLTFAALYAPLDGMNEKGFAISVNMIQDTKSIAQSGQAADITTTTAVRMLLNKAANVEEALQLLQNYNMHASQGLMIHFALTDTTGRSVAVEYVDNVMQVVETSILTNFYVAEGSRYGIGTAQSQERFRILQQALESQKTFDRTQVRDVLDSVSKDNFDEFASTEWSTVYRLNEGKADYYHREQYDRCYTFDLKK